VITFAAIVEFLCGVESGESQNIKTPFTNPEEQKPSPSALPVILGILVLH